MSAERGEIENGEDDQGRITELVSQSYFAIISFRNLSIAIFV